MFNRRFSTPTLVACALFATGCRDREITAYRAPRDAQSPLQIPAEGQLPPGHPPINGGGAEAGPGAMTGDVPTAAGAALTWTAPNHWQPKAASAMRKASYSISGANGAAGDLAITAFPGDTGGLFANVNRWRGQVGLAPIDEAGLPAAIEHIELNGLHIELVDLLGQANGTPVRLLGAIVPFEGQTWFFKLTGPDALVAGEKPAFREFLGTIRPRTP